MFLPKTNQMRFAHSFQGFSQHGPVVWIMVAQKRLMQTALFFSLGDKDFVCLVIDPMNRVLFRVVHGGGHGHR